MQSLQRARLIFALAATVAPMAGCGRESTVHSVTAVTPSQAKKVVKFFNSEKCGRGQVFIRYVKPTVDREGAEEGGFRSWCVEPAQAYRKVALEVHCPAHTGLVIEFARHRALCSHTTHR
jgi:hypothetical protein